ncbi:MAG: hypothetical protein M3Q07_26235, partial [Pseudobdellovibrionaceae bacterium]|nr:hypothetical protein [Pseudobdellovibrionaceae bacterium]
MLINNKSKRHHEAGFSLIDVMIAAVLVVVIAVMVSNFMSKGQKQAAQQATQDQSIKIRQSLADLLKRDLAYVVNPADVVVLSLHEMTIKRPKLQPGNIRPDLTQTYQVRYRGVCTPIPAALQTPLSSFNFATLPVALQKRSSCTTTAALKCGAGTYPQVRIEPDAGANIPAYPGTPLPNLTTQSKAFHGS